MLKRFRQYTPAEAAQLQREVEIAKTVTRSTVSAWEAEASLVEEDSKQKIAWYNASSRIATAVADGYEAMSGAVRNISFQLGRVEQAKEEIRKVSPSAIDAHLELSDSFAQKYLPGNRK